MTDAQYSALSLNKQAQYDPYKRVAGSGIEYRMFARFNSGIQATIQSGRYVEDILDPSVQYLELTLFDHSVDTKNFPGLRNESFTTVKICLLYTSPSPRDQRGSRMPSSA